jgi:hypothetical protein
MLLPVLFAAATPIPASAAAFLADTLHLARYRAAAVDLNGDGRPEVLAYAEEPAHCGSGGCDLTVLSPTARGWRVVTTMSVTRPPIRLLPGKTRGWHDLGVHVAGGGILPGHDVRLRFDGARYPGNPTLAPALRPGSAAKRIVLR